MDSPTPQPAQPKDISKGSFLIIVVVLACIVLSTGGFAVNYYYNGPCGVNRVKKATAILDDQFQVYSDAFSIASSTSRISLDGPVSELQRIQREAEKIEVPACMETAKTEYVLMMETSVQGFLAFMSDLPDATVGDLMDQSDQHLTQYSDEMLAVDECKPFCKK